MTPGEKRELLHWLDDQCTAYGTLSTHHILRYRALRKLIDDLEAEIAGYRNE